MDDTPGWLVESARSLAVAVRSGRRRLRLSQRALAELAGISQSSVARLEAERDVRSDVVRAVLRALGLRLVVVGAEIDERVEDRVRDTGGRRLPAHLPAHRLDRLPIRTWMRRWSRGGPLLEPRGDYWCFRREAPVRRDRVRSASP